MRGKQNLFSTVAVSAVAVVLLFSGPTTARADTTNLNTGESINLATLIDNSLSVQIGDKVFGDFAFSYFDYGAPDTDLAASNVVVKALSNNFGFGLQFQEPLFALNTKTKDVEFKYTAMVATNSSDLISGMLLGITGNAGGAGTGTVAEDAFSDTWGGTLVGSLAAAVPSPLSDTNSLTPALTKLWIQKDVQVSGNNGGGGSFATITILDQTFSQIPEPSTVLLVGLALLGVVALKRRW